jgi:hypothetical protein
LLLLLLSAGTINLDTMKLQEPPPGHWKRVVGHLKLRPDQIDHVCTGFQVRCCCWLCCIEKASHLDLIFSNGESCALIRVSNL